MYFSDPEPEVSQLNFQGLDDVDQTIIINENIDNDENQSNTKV